MRRSAILLYALLYWGTYCHLQAPWDPPENKWTLEDCVKTGHFIDHPETDPDFRDLEDN